MEPSPNELPDKLQWIFYFVAGVVAIGNTFTWLFGGRKRYRGGDDDDERNRKDERDREQLLQDRERFKTNLDIESLRRDLEQVVGATRAGLEKLVRDSIKEAMTEFRTDMLRVIEEKTETRGHR